MSDGNTDRLDSATSLARGFLLASRWAGDSPSDDAHERIPILADADLAKEHEAIGLLPDDRRAALGVVWLSREKPARIDEALDLHWSWLADELRDENPALVLQLLGALRPGLAKETLRALWSGLRQTKSSDLEIGHPAPALAAHLRRWVFSCFALVAERERGERSLAAVLFLGKRDLYLLVQDVGLRSIARAGGGGGREEILRLLQAQGGAEATRISKLLQKNAAENASGSDSEESDDPAEVRASALVRRAVEASSGSGGDLVGLVGIGTLALALSSEPRSFAVQIAQRMTKEVGSRLVEWRDEHAAGDDEGRDESAAEVLERLANVLSRSASSALTKGDS